MSVTFDPKKHAERCARCDEPLRRGREVWLLLHDRTQQYHRPGSVFGQRLERGDLVDENQGGFALGSGCAKIELAETLEWLAGEREAGR